MKKVILSLGLVLSSLTVLAEAKTPDELSSEQMKAVSQISQSVVTVDEGKIKDFMLCAGFNANVAQNYSDKYANKSVVEFQKLFLGDLAWEAPAYAEKCVKLTGDNNLNNTTSNCKSADPEKEMFCEIATAQVKGDKRMLKVIMANVVGKDGTVDSQKLENLVNTASPKNPYIFSESVSSTILSQTSASGLSDLLTDGLDKAIHPLYKALKTK